MKDFSCGELRPEHVGKRVSLAGWVHRRRDHGGIIFIDLRDREGITQIVFDPKNSKQAHDIASKVRSEYVLRVWGEVSRRPPGTENPKLPTGEIEVIADKAEILNTSKTPPFPITGELNVDESVRLKYRYLDLRRERMKENIILRHRVIMFIRDFLDKKGFIEIETPILIKSTPEGARDYVVPSRLHPGKFYALPQSPQQLKQLLMVAGFERYFQKARCFRDEDLRADRQPEFTQLDIEMSFVSEEDILSLIEELFTALVENIKPEFRVPKPFPRLSYKEVMDKYGTDKPDLRFGLELKDLTDVLSESEFAIFRKASAEGGVIKGFCAPGCGGYSKKELEELSDFVRARGAKGLITLSFSEDGVKSVAAKYLAEGQISELARITGAKNGDLVLIIADKEKIVNTALSQLRVEMGRRLGLMDPKVLYFLFILDYPLFEWNEGRWEPMHHPFTAPRDEDIPLLDTDPGKVRAKHYDFVCNGCELSSGSIRIHRKDIQEKVFKILGYTDEELIPSKHLHTYKLSF